MGDQVGLGIATTSCNNGDQPVHFFAFPETDHSVITQDLYRMSGGATNDDRFEQIGQGWAKHAFGANQDDDCNFGCTPSDFTMLGVGCSDPYDAGENAIYTLLGSRAWINPFTGSFPANAADHSGHTHTGVSHRLLVNNSDLNTAMNPGATYWAEVTYDIRQEYQWCQAHPGQCNMYNNASYRRFNVSGMTSFTFSGVGATVRMTPVINAWTGATINMIEPDPGVDGRAFIAYKVTNPAAGVWHYEYGVYNRNLDRAIQLFSVPINSGAALSNIGFHAPQNPDPALNDGTLNNAGFSNAAWTSNQTPSDIAWNSETLAQNQNANAIRWSTMYNFRFDSNRPPMPTNATVGFFKTGNPVTVAIQGPGPEGGVTPTPTPEVSPTETPTATPGASPSVSPGEAPTPTPSSPAQAQNLSTRLQVGTGNDVGIGGFIITGTTPKTVLIRGIGPSLGGTGLTVLPDPLLELNGPDGFVTLTNDNWRSTQEAAIQATGIPPTNDLESAILATLAPGSYTAILQGSGGGIGIGLVEIYDLGPASTSKMANISTRARVETGNNVAIAGFILGVGTEPDPIVVRAIGIGITGPPPLDARLELRDSNGRIIASNNNWQDDPAQAAMISAAGLAPSNASDAAIAVTLGPGAYTALLLGENDAAGVGLVEVYDHPTVSATPTPPFVTPTPCSFTMLTENFDGVSAPTLPVGWVATNAQGEDPLWVTSITAPDSPPNGAFIDDPGTVSDKRLETPPINIPFDIGPLVLSFRSNFALDPVFGGARFFDGAVLEMSSPQINGGAFTDITDPAFGSTFVTGGYNGTVSTEFGNPIGGRRAWGQSSGGYVNTVVRINNVGDLAGSGFRFRFRMCSDSGVSGTGWWIDNVTLTVCEGGFPTPTAAPSPTPTPTPPGPSPTCFGLMPCHTPSPTPIGACTENFDSVTPPALPPGWVASNPVPGDGNGWVTTTTDPDTPPNDVFCPDEDGISDKVLDRWAVVVNSVSPTLSFRNNFNTEFSDGVYWDGGVLEISSPNISGGEFLDITDSHVGATCMAGCYTGEISGDASNPLAGRMAWSGNSNGYIDTVIDLGPNLNGETITLRWRLGSDEAVAAPGWHIDSLSMGGASCQ